MTPMANPWRSPMNKLVFITGGSRGIGKAMVSTFAKAGYLVAFSYLNQKKLADSLVRQINKKVLAIPMDQSSPQSITKGLKKIVTYFEQPINLLINNAAVSQEKPFDSITTDDWSHMLNINLQGPFLLAQQVLPNMVKTNWGRIINITSIGGQWGGYNQVHYAASKAGLISLTQSLAKIYSPKGITTNAIAIGLVATDMSSNELSTAEGKAKVSAIPCQRVGTAHEIAQTALFLASDEAAYITGQTVNTNGGMYFG